MGRKIFCRLFLNYSDKKLIMRNKEYKMLFEKIREIVNDKDPMNLMGGAPMDEYDNEVTRILVQLKNTSDEKILSNEIYDIFLKSFGNDIGSKEKYLELAHRIFEEKKILKH